MDPGKKIITNEILLLLFTMYKTYYISQYMFYSLYYNLYRYKALLHCCFLCLEKGRIYLFFLFLPLILCSYCLHSYDLK